MLLSVVVLALAACAAPPGTAATSAPATTTSAPAVAATLPPVATPVAAVNSGPAIPVIGTENFYADLLNPIGGAPAPAPRSPKTPPSGAPHVASPPPPTPPPPDPPTARPSN